MAIKITDECINCGACEPECPNTAIYEGGAEWKFSEGTSLKGPYTGKNSMITSAVGLKNGGNMLTKVS